jgi:hypothetical protein
MPEPAIAVRGVANVRALSSEITSTRVLAATPQRRMPPHLVARGESHRSEVGLLAGCGGRWRHHAALHTHGRWRHGRWCGSWRASDCRLCRLLGVRFATAVFSSHGGIRTCCVCGIGTSSLQDGLELKCGLLGGAVDARAEEVGAEVRNRRHGQHAQHTRVLQVELARQLLKRDRHRGNQRPGRQPTDPPPGRAAQARSVDRSRAAGRRLLGIGSDRSL